MDNASIARLKRLLSELQAEVEHAETYQQPPSTGQRMVSPSATESRPATPPSEDEHALRPALYKHKLAARGDLLDGIFGGPTDLLDAMRMSSLEGVYNLSVMMLVFSVLYISVRNVMEKGVLLDTANLVCTPVFRDALLLGVVCVGCFAIGVLVHAFVAMYIRGYLRPGVLGALYTVAQVAMNTGVVVWLYSITIGPIMASSALIFMMVCSLKYHSYVATVHLLMKQLAKPGDAPPPKLKGKTVAKPPSKTLRKRRAGAGDDGDASGDDPGDDAVAPLEEFRACVSIEGFVYFMCAPTLVYEPVYPRLKFIRWAYVWQKVMELCVCVVVSFAIMSQFMLPVLQSGVHLPFWFAVLKLALPSFLMWLVGFYALFHCYLNIAAEVTRFADRQFYKGWWNATTLGSFWRTWNLPVHHFAHRHLFFDTQHYFGMSKTAASLVTFFVSAVLHEVLFSVAFKTVRVWFFVGMLAQFPLIVISEQLRGTRRGNIFMWVSLFFGQPLIEILYFREWFETHDSFFCVA